MLRKAVLAGGLVSTLTTGALFGGAFAVSMGAGAMAADVSLANADYFGQDSTDIALDNAISSFTAVAVVDIDALSTVMLKGAPLGKYTLINFMGSNNTNDIGVQTNYTTVNNVSVINTSGMYGVWNNGGAYAVGMNSGFELADFWVGADSVTVLLTYSYDNGTTAVFTMLDANGVVLSQLGGTWNTSLKGSTSTFDLVEFEDTIVTAAGVFENVVTKEEAYALGKEAAIWAQTENFYWESGSSEWAGIKWALTDGGTPSANLLLSETVNTIFNNNETATVTMDGAVTVTSMSIDAGKYTFQGSSAAEDSVSSGTLSVAKNAQATLDKLTITATNGITNAGKLTINNSTVNAAITNTGTLTIDGGADVNAAVTNTGTLNFKNGDLDFAITNNNRLYITDATIDGASASITGTGSAQLSGTINLKNFTGTVGQEVIPTTSNGFGSITTTYQVVSCTAGSSAQYVTTWQINGAKVQGTISYSESGVLSVSENGTVYYVSVDEVAYDAGSDFDGATSLALNGGTLTIDTAEELAAGFITSTEKGGTINLNGRKLAQSMLGTLGAETTLRGAIGSIYDIGDDMALAANLTLSESDWKGTITMGDVTTPEADLDITAFGKNQSSVLLGQVDVNSLQSGSSATVGAHALALGGGNSSVGGTLSVLGPLTLGNATSAAVLNVGGQLNAAEGVTLGNAGSALIVGSLSALSLKIEDTAVLNELCSFARTGAITLITVTDAATGADPASVNLLYKGKPVENSPGSKYTIHSGWSGNAYQMTATTNENYVTERLQPTSPNAVAGASMLSDAFIASDPQVNAPDSDLAAILNAVDAGTVGNEQAAAVAGASTAALSMAFSGDVERQLRAIRNRTTTMGVNECVINEGMPYFNAWINGEGNRGELDKDGTMAGYTLDSWGGTVGFDVDVNPNLTLGMAVTAMYGDVTVDGPDTLDGDMDTYYVSAFARYAKRAWTHTFVATVGTMDSSYERTVRYGGGSYMTKGDTDGMAFGLMYEVARAFTLDRNGDVGGQLVANVAYRHTSVGGYTETGRDAALKVDDQTLDTITFGVGGRMQAVVGKNMFNRTSLFEARALAKLDVGDRSSEADVAFLGGRKTATVESAELGAFGVELGAGLSIPVGDEEDGTIFFDVSAELRSGYTNVNGTVGYRINF